LDKPLTVIKRSSNREIDFPEELKEKLVELVVYQNYSKEEVAKSNSHSK